jgi:hypothetical protein
VSLKDAVTKFTESVTDLTNLEVTTYTGRLEEAIDANTGQIKWNEFKPGSGKLVLVAATLVRPNLDTVNFRAAELDHGDLPGLFQLHVAAVESAQNGRLAMAKLLTGLLPATLKL